MGRGSRARASRAERRVLKERAASALKHGLPSAPVTPKLGTVARRDPQVVPGSLHPSERSTPDRRMPLAVKLLGLGIGLLGLLYGLTLFRDRSAPVEPRAPIVAKPLK